MSNYANWIKTGNLIYYLSHCHSSSAEHQMRQKTVVIFLSFLTLIYNCSFKRNGTFRLTVFTAHLLAILLNVIHIEGENRMFQARLRSPMDLFVMREIQQQQKINNETNWICTQAKAVVEVVIYIVCMYIDSFSVLSLQSGVFQPSWLWSVWKFP